MIQKPVQLLKRDDVVRRCAQGSAETVEKCKQALNEILSTITSLPVDIQIDKFGGEGSVRNEVVRQMVQAGYSVTPSQLLPSTCFTIK